MVGAIFYRDSSGTYLNLPIEKIAALLLYRVAQGQCFANGNKRTALLSCYFFLFNNGFTFRIDRGEMNDLLWGFAKDPDDPVAPARYSVEDAQDYTQMGG
jgi:death-on-curing family protein